MARDPHEAVAAARTGRGRRLMAPVAGGFAGALMALIFIGHMAIVLVYHMPAFVERRAQRDAPSGLAVLALAATTGSMFFWTGFGAGTAVLFSMAEERFPTNSGVVPSAAYLAVIAGVALVSAPLPFVLMWRLRVHLLVEYAVFLAIFGLMVPWIAATE